MVIKCDSKVTGEKVYRDENAVGMFLNDILQEETNIRENLGAPKPIVMAAEDWEKLKNATECHICNESLLKGNILDSLPVWNNETNCYFSQSHKKSFYVKQKRKGKHRVERVDRTRR